MRMRADDGIDASVEIPAHRCLLRSRLRMEIEEDDVRLVTNLAQDSLDLLKRTIHVGHEDAAGHIDDGDVLRAMGIDAIAFPRRSVRVIGGADEKRLVVDELQNVLLVPDMIARRHDVGAPMVERIERLARKPLAPRRIFPVDDDDVHRLFLADSRCEATERLPARSAANISNQHDSQNITTSRAPEVFPTGTNLVDTFSYSRAFNKRQAALLPLASYFLFAGQLTY